MILWLIIIILILVLFYVFYRKKATEPFTESEIPLKIFQTWSTKLLPVHMKKNCKLLQKQNPQFEYFLFDDQDCLDFIKENFDESVANAFNRLVPGAYKADLWRYCVMYIHGGIYLDMKIRCVGDFRLIELTKEEHYVKDRDSNDFMSPHFGIYNAVMVQRPKNPLMMDCIKQIVKNVNENEYGFGYLYPTGPGLLGFLYEKNKNRYNLNEIDMFHDETREIIRYNNRVVLEHYPEYRKEQLLYQNELHYSALWKRESIYLLE